MLEDTDQQDVKLVLASRSPRRIQLLREAGYRFRQQTPPFDDSGALEEGDNGDTAQQVATELARQKAESLADAVESGLVVLAADTVCVGTDGTLLGQPADAAEAGAMIRQFVGRAHEVVTGVALTVAGSGRLRVFADTALVEFGPLEEAELERYLAGDQWRGKAGGYNLFDRQEAGWPIAVEGDPATVVGLPMRRLKGVLAGFGVVPEGAGERAPR